jgi:hypothetical protein
MIFRKSVFNFEKLLFTTFLAAYVMIKVYFGCAYSYRISHPLKLFTQSKNGMHLNNFKLQLILHSCTMFQVKN